MWLLKFHLAFSILCLITMYGSLFFIDKEKREMLKKLTKEEDATWIQKLRAKIRSIISCFVPIINIALAIAALIIYFGSEETIKDILKKKIKEKQTENKSMI